MRILTAAVLLLLASFANAGTCYISEYAKVGTDSFGQVVQIASEPAVTVQTVTFTTSTASAAFNETTTFIRIVCDELAHFDFGTSPTATTSDPYLAADSREYFHVPGSGSWKVAFKDSS